MYKKFVPLDTSQCPSKNPYEIRTFMGEPLTTQRPGWLLENCGYGRGCNTQQSATADKYLTLEDEIRHIHRRTQANIYAKRYRNKCKQGDTYRSCVMSQRTPQDLKRHAILREKYLKVHHDMDEYVHDMGDMYTNHPRLIKLNSPPGGSEEDVDKEEEGMENEDGDLKLQLASPECSIEMMYMPTQRIVSSNISYMIIPCNTKNVIHACTFKIRTV